MNVRAHGQKIQRLKGQFCFVFLLFVTEIKILFQKSKACKIHAQNGHANQFKELWSKYVDYNPPKHSAQSWAAKGGGAQGQCPPLGLSGGALTPPLANENNKTH